MTETTDGMRPFERSLPMALLKARDDLARRRREGKLPLPDIQSRS